MTEHKYDRRKQDAEIVELKANMQKFEEKLDNVEKSVEGLLSLWRDGIGAVRVIKFLAWLAASIAAIVAGINIWGGK